MSTQGVSPLNTQQMFAVCAFFDIDYCES